MNLAHALKLPLELAAPAPPSARAAAHPAVPDVKLPVPLSARSRTPSAVSQTSDALSVPGTKSEPGSARSAQSEDALAAWDGESAASDRDDLAEEAGPAAEEPGSPGGAKRRDGKKRWRRLSNALSLPVRKGRATARSKGGGERQPSHRSVRPPALPQASAGRSFENKIPPFFFGIEDGRGREWLAGAGGGGGGGAQTAPAATSTAPAHQPQGSANAETTPAGAPAAAADRTQRPDATCEGKNR